MNDGDTGYHIRAGEIILKTFSVPTMDPFSNASPPIPWTAHEWFSEVIMALVHRAGGLTGVVLFFSLILSATGFVLFQFLKRRCNIFIAAAVTLLVTASTTLHWLARPHVFSLLLTLVFCILLDDFQ